LAEKNDDEQRALALLVYTPKFQSAFYEIGARALSSLGSRSTAALALDQAYLSLSLFKLHHASLKIGHAAARSGGVQPVSDRNLSSVLPPEGLRSETRDRDLKPLSVSELLKEAGLTAGGSVAWGEQIPERSSGIYIVTILNPRTVELGGLPEPLRARWNQGQQIVYIGRSVHLPTHHLGIG
jgi:hypothetical protein